MQMKMLKANAIGIHPPPFGGIYQTEFRAVQLFYDKNVLRPYNAWFDCDLRPYEDIKM